jgi:hypothetical protein
VGVVYQRDSPMSSKWDQVFPGFGGSRKWRKAAGFQRLLPGTGPIPDQGRAQSRSGPPRSGPPSRSSRFRS